MSPFSAVVKRCCLSLQSSKRCCAFTHLGLPATHSRLQPAPSHPFTQVARRLQRQVPPTGAAADADAAADDGSQADVNQAWEDAVAKAAKKIGWFQAWDARFQHHRQLGRYLKCHGAYVLLLVPPLLLVRCCCMA